MQKKQEKKLAALAAHELELATWLIEDNHAAVEQA